MATSINNSGEVAGTFTAANGNVEGFLLNGANLTTYEAPGSTNTTFLGVNNKGQVVGTFMDANQVQHGLLFDVNANTFTPIDAPNGVGTTTLNGLNDMGQFVGFYVDGNNLTHGLLVSTVPEPSPLLLALLPALALGLRGAFRAARQRAARSPTQAALAL
jgi:probable HAF family extracellular repeat protein